MKLTPVGKLIGLILAFGVAFGGMKLWGRFGGVIAPSANGGASVNPGKVDLPSISGDTGNGTSGAITLPGVGLGAADKPEVRMLVWAWNAQMGMMFANGGPQATEGSLMAKNGVNLKFIRQDDSGKMQEALVAFATELSRGNANPSSGAHFVGIMGDGAATFLQGINSTLKKLGPEYVAKVVGSAGYSRGEDKFMGPEKWKTDPLNSRGGVVAGVLRDGDWNIAQKWLGDNGLKTNPDEKTWDPEALNWIAANDYIDAAEKYVAGYSEERPVVKNGKPTGERKRITVEGVVTWTPGDVTIAQKKGGLVSIVSTKEYNTQMPHVIIGIDKWMKTHRSTVEGMIQAVAEGGTAIKSSPAAIDHAAAISNKVYAEKGTEPAYWAKYYKGTREQDKSGVMVDLGGSSVNNLADSLLLFGLVPGSLNVFSATYRVFGDIVVAQYPKLVPSYPSVAEILDTSYIQAVAKRVQAAGGAISQPTKITSNPAPIENVISKKVWHIHFQTGRASFTGDAVKDLEKLRRDLLVASSTQVQIHGHTDNQGNPTANMSLSEQRAFAVKKWLEKEFSVNFPSGRIKVVAHGQTEPAESNETETGRAQNRRVEVVIGIGK